MPRRPPHARTLPASPGRRVERGGGFDALKDLRGTLPASSITGKSGKGKPEATIRQAEAPPTALSEDDISLFKSALDDATPLRPANRVVLEPPKPAPLPRTRVSEGEPGPKRTSTAPRADEDVFRFEMRDVQPIRDTGRLDLRAPAHRRTRGDDPAAEIPPFSARTMLEHLPSGVAADDPKALLDWALQGTRPLKADNRAVVSTPPAAPHPVQRQADDRSVLAETLGTPLSLEDRLDTGDETAFLRPGIPRRVLTDLRRGRWVVQGQLDLHGLVRDEARAALSAFLGESLHHGRRCVRLIHGKGLGSPGRFPVLKHLSRGWLAQREEILAFCQAPPHDGGGGALLILLRASGQGAGRAM